MDNNSINYNYGAIWGESCNLTTVGTNGSSSHYGTYDQNGNIAELILFKKLDYTYSFAAIGGAFSSTSENELFINRFNLERSSDIGIRLCSSVYINNDNTWVTIGDINNRPDINGIGGVNYEYNISKYELTNAEYVNFLNIKNDIVDKYELFFATIDENQGIYKNTDGVYICKYEMQKKPVNYITIGNILRYINWKNNTIFVSEKDADTETGVYELLGELNPDINNIKIKPKKISIVPGVNDNEFAYYWLPSEDEWYKAAYFDGNKYYEYATQSYDMPCSTDANENGDGTYCKEFPSISPTPTITSSPSPSASRSIQSYSPNKTYNSANYKNNQLSKVGSNGGPSYYGTYDQNGNINELIYEKSYDSDIVSIRGGSFKSHLSELLLNKSYTNIRSETIGFRICCNNPYNDKNFVKISNPNNESDINNLGSVDYEYYISQFCITNNDYILFLNAKNSVVDKYELFIDFNSEYQGILKEYGGKYIVKANMGNIPVNFITIGNALRYINWKNNCLKTTPELADTETGSYILNKNLNPDINLIIKNIDECNYWLPTDNEWHKAAYYNGHYKYYNKFATQYDLEPASSTIDFAFNGSPVGSIPLPTPTPTPTNTPTPSSASISRNIYEWGSNNTEIIKYPKLIEKDDTYVGSAFNFNSIFAGSDFFLLSRDDKVIFPFKNNSNGQLGLNISKDNEYIEKLNTPISEINSKWKDISVGENFVYLIDQYDNAYRWGSNIYNVLNSTLDKINIPSRLILEDSTNLFRSVSCGYDHVFLVTMDGRLMMCGSAHKQETSKFIQYMSGTDWNEVFTRNNLTFATKIDDDNLYLIGGILPDSDIYQQYITLNSNPIVVGQGMLNYNSVSVGDNHLLLVKSDGSLWSFGLNNHFQLGLEVDYLNTLTRIDNKTNWSKVACGSTHSLAINKLGVLYGWGNGKDYQFGLEGIEYLKIPTNIWTGNWLDISAYENISGGISANIQQMIVTQTPSNTCSNTPTPSITQEPIPTSTPTNTLTPSVTQTPTPSQTLVIPLFHVIIITTTPSPSPSETKPVTPTPTVTQSRPRIKDFYVPAAPPILISDPPYNFNSPMETLL